MTSYVHSDPITLGVNMTCTFIPKLKITVRACCGYIIHAGLYVEH